MEFFLPSVIVFLSAMLITWYIAPKLTPMIIAILSFIFLCYGVYDHYHQFEAEYRLSTWQEIFKIYAPAIMIFAVIIFIIIGIFSFFTSGTVPIPSLNTSSAYMLNSLSSASNSIANSFSSASSSFSSAKNSLQLSSNRNKSPSRSFLETI